jgi:pyruvate-ferredoxin/flavodoxin oxidoreductase
LYRYNPELKKQGQNPFILDSSEPGLPYRDFIKGEIRYSQLMNTFPGYANEMYELAEQNAKQRYETYRQLAH